MAEPTVKRGKKKAFSDKKARECIGWTIGFRLSEEVEARGADAIVWHVKVVRWMDRGSSGPLGPFTTIATGPDDPPTVIQDIGDVAYILADQMTCSRALACGSSPPIDWRVTPVYSEAP